MPGNPLEIQQSPKKTFSKASCPILACKSFKSTVGAAASAPNTLDAPEWAAMRCAGKERWRRKSEHSDKWKLCDNNPGLRPEKAG